MAQKHLWEKALRRVSLLPHGGERRWSDTPTGRRGEILRKSLEIQAGERAEASATGPDRRATP